MASSDLEIRSPNSTFKSAQIKQVAEMALVLAKDALMSGKRGKEVSDAVMIGLQSHREELKETDGLKMMMEIVEVLEDVLMPKSSDFRKLFSGCFQSIQKYYKNK